MVIVRPWSSSKDVPAGFLFQRKRSVNLVTLSGLPVNGLAPDHCWS